MLTKEKSQALAASGFQMKLGIDDPKSITRPRKWQRVLRAFLSGRTFNRFEAERELHDHCLHTTVAALEGRGIRIDRDDETVPGFAGISTHCKRYRLTNPESRQRAAELLGVSHSES